MATRYQKYYKRKLAEDPSFVKRRNLARYGLSIEDFETMLDSQEGCCGFCEKPFMAQSPCVDHNHDTGVVRKLLCRSCNSLLGWYENHTDEILAYLKGGVDLGD